MHFLTLPSRQQQAHGFAHLCGASLINWVVDLLPSNSNKKLFEFLFGGVDDAAAIKGGANIVVVSQSAMHNVQ